MTESASSYTFDDLPLNAKCKKCGIEFLPYQVGQSYCSRKCQHASTRNSARDNRSTEFVGVDGEGINLLLPDGTKTHRYIMLSVGDQTLWKNGEELTHRDIFPFLYEQFLENPSACYVGFFLGYDFTCWLKSITEEKAQELFHPVKRARHVCEKEGKSPCKQKSCGPNPTPVPLWVGDWEIDILALKRFKLRPRSIAKKNPNAWLYICDTGSFFQKSFLNVIEPTIKKWPHGAPCSETEFERVYEGKNSRADEYTVGDTSYYADMVKYNTLENDILARTMTIVNGGFVEAGIKLKKDQFYGPGQLAQNWLNQQAALGNLLWRQDKGDRPGLESILPKDVIEAARMSYYGGWFETFIHGHIPGVTYEYDITSAYPHIMASLPCLCGDWARGRQDGKYNLVWAKVEGRNPFVGAMPFRNPRGNILRPPFTTSWYWLHEIQSAYNAGFIHQYEVSDSYAYYPCDHDAPMRGLADMFQQRLRVGKATPQGVGLKLSYNSAYGKCAQSVGNPKFGNPIYASLITAGTRTMICDAIATHPNGAKDLAMIATDAVYFRTPHPTLHIKDDELGAWEGSTKTNLTIMKPGVYWDDYTREAIADNRTVVLKSRGISAKALSENISRIDGMFTRLYDLDLQSEWPKLSIRVPFSIVSPKLALARGKWNTCGKVQYDLPREDQCALAPKRMNAYIDGDIIRSESMFVPIKESVTTPYDKRFGFQQLQVDLELELTQDGTIDDAVGSWVREIVTKP